MSGRCDMKLNPKNADKQISKKIETSNDKTVETLHTYKSSFIIAQHFLKYVNRKFYDILHVYYLLLPILFNRRATRNPKFF